MSLDVGRESASEESLRLKDRASGCHASIDGVNLEHVETHLIYLKMENEFPGIRPLATVEQLEVASCSNRCGTFVTRRRSQNVNRKGMPDCPRES